MTSMQCSRLRAGVLHSASDTAHKYYHGFIPNLWLASSHHPVRRLRKSDHFHSNFYSYLDLLLSNYRHPHHPHHR